MSSRGNRFRPSSAVSHTRWLPVATAAPVSRLRGAGPGRQGLFVLPEAERDAAGPEAPTVDEQLAHAHAQGVARGQELAAGAFADERTRLLATVHDVAALRRRVLGAAEHDVMQLAVSMARRILHREVQLDPDILLSMAHVALGRLGDRPVATLHLHPDDLATVNQQRPVTEGITLVSDNDVPRGGCRIVSPSGEIDLGVDAQMTELSRVLLGELSGVERVQLH